MRCNPRYAFSLVELSIVLVILGLLVGSVLSGQALIRSAELRSVIRQYEQIITATQSFKDKYFSLPGDMNTATQFWGVAGGTGNDATCRMAVSTTQATCNGDGDGKLATTTTGPEPMRFWQHLANAGLIEGQFTGAFVGGGLTSVSSVDAPSGKPSQSLWMTTYTGTISGAVTLYDGNYDNTLWIGKYHANLFPYDGFMTPEELWNIDTKLDDGKPATGKDVVYARLANVSACTDNTGGANLSAQYLLTATTTSCVSMFRQVY